MLELASLFAISAFAVAAFLLSANAKETCDSVADHHLPTYGGVTVVIKLTDGTPINCLGILLTSEEYLAERKYQHVLTSARCVKQDNVDYIRVSVYKTSK